MLHKFGLSIKHVRQATLIRCRNISSHTLSQTRSPVSCPVSTRGNDSCYCSNGPPYFIIPGCVMYNPPNLHTVLFGDTGLCKELLSVQQREEKREKNKSKEEPEREREKERTCVQSTEELICKSNINVCNT